MLFDMHADITFEYHAPAFSFLSVDRAIAAAFQFHPRKDLFNLKKKVAMGVLKQMIDANGPMPTGRYRLMVTFNMFKNTGDANIVRLS